MSNTAIKVEHLSKMYHKGVLGYQTIREQMAYRFAKLRHKEDPNSRIGQDNLGDPEAFWALDDISFEVEQGETFGVVGNNGSGKSTLLKILSQITAPTRGTVDIAGKVASLLEVGTGFHPEMTGRENVYLNGAILGMSRAEITRKFDDIVDYSGTGAFIDTPVKRYSSGMYVRLAFSVAAHLDSDIVILDEVLSVGDAQYQKKCLDTMDQISRDSGRTVLFVSHSPASVRRLCRRCLWLDQGRMIKIGDADDVMNDYAGDADITDCRYQVAWKDPKTAPQNDDILIRSIAICDPAGNELSVLTTHTEFCIQIRFTVKHDGVHAGLGCVLRDESGTPVFTTLNNLTEEYGTPMNAGEYVSICTIPADLMNTFSGFFDVNYFSHDFSVLLHVEKPLKILVSEHPVLRNGYPFVYAGSLRPQMHWTTRPFAESK